MIKLQWPWRKIKERKKRGHNTATRLVQLLYRTGGNPDIRFFIESFICSENRELEDLGIEKVKEKVGYELTEIQEGKRREGGY